MPSKPRIAVIGAGLAGLTAALAVRILVKTRFPRPALQVLPPRGMAGLACGLTMERAKHAIRVPAGREAVVMYARPGKVRALATQDDQDIAAAMAGELTAWLGVPRRQMVEFWVQRWRYAVVHCDPRARQRAMAIKVQLRALADRIPVWVAGDYLDSPSLEGAVASAEKAARACRDHFESKHSRTDRLLSGYGL